MAAIGMVIPEYADSIQESRLSESLVSLAKISNPQSANVPAQKSRRPKSIHVNSDFEAFRDAKGLGISVRKFTPICAVLEINSRTRL
jgi:hypothetical protein